MRSLRINIEQKDVVKDSFYAKNKGVRLLTKILLYIALFLSLQSAKAQSIYFGNDANNPVQCTCLNNATNLSNGQFSELVTIESASAETWQVTNIIGFYEITSAAPPLLPTPITIGTLIPETGAGTGIYQLAGIHIDGLTFEVEVSNGTTTLSIGNSCYYPNPVIINFPAEVCMSSLPIPLEADVNGVDGTGVFTIDGVTATIFDPIAMGPGNYLLAYTFDAGEATANDANDPGCTITLEKNVTVFPVPTIAVNYQVNVALGSDCEALIIPEMVLEGNYPCLDTDYYIVVYDLQGNPIPGNLVTGEYLDEILPVQVFTVAGNYTGQGTIYISLGTIPVLACPDDTNLATLAQNVYLIQDTIYNNDPSIIPVNFACFSNLVVPPAGAHNYHLDTFTVSHDGIYVFEGYGDFGAISGALFEMAFVPNNGPCTNIMATSMPRPLGEGYYPTEADVVRLNVQLHAGTSYILLTFAQNTGNIGPYEWAAWSMDNIGALIGFDALEASLPLPLYCENWEEILDNTNSFDYLGYPDDGASCQPLQITFNDFLVENGDCGPATITRTFSGIDIFNDIATCTQTITFDAVNMSDLTLPPKTFTLECHEIFDTTAIGNPHPTETGYPFVLTAFGAKYLNPVFCNLASTYTDQPHIYLCGDNYQFVRRWLILDDCTNEIQNYEQIIRVGDFTAPAIDCSSPDNDLDGLPDTLFFSSSPLDCNAVINVPHPIVSDNCSSWTVFTEIVTEQENPIYNQFGNVIGFDVETVVLGTLEDGETNRVIDGIPAGCHRIRYTATDECGNVSVSECPFCVSDLINPVAVCDDNLNLSLENDGYGRLYAVDVDEGSNDNCGVDFLKVRRLITMDANCTPLLTPYYTDWADFVEFSCCDVNENVEIQLQVTDDSGNQNICWTGVLVEDKLKPICVAPGPIFTTCETVPFDFDVNDMALLEQEFGMPVGIDNCQVDEITELTPIVNLTDCGYGTIIRRFQVADAYGNVSPNVCEQLITITISKNYTIKFPRDYMTECSSPDPDTLELFSYGCEALTVDVDDAIYSVPNGACYQILRTYKIIDWCEYDGSSPPVVIGRDEDCDGTLGDEDVWLIRRNGQIYLDRNNNENDANPAIGTKGTFCDGSTNPNGYWRTITSNGYWEYVQVIMVNDVTEPVVSFTPPPAFCSNSNDCAGDVNVNFTVDEMCSASDLTITVYLDLNADGPLDNIDVTEQALIGSYPNFLITGTYPMGSHQFDVHVADGCGNENITFIPFIIVDCFAPTPVCIDGLSTTLEPLPPGTDADGDGDIDNAAKEIFALNYIVNSGLVDCTGPIRYSIHLTDLVINGADIPNPTQASLFVTCDEIGAPLIRVYAWDSAFNPYALQPDGSTGGPNYDFCETFLSVQDNQGACTTATQTMGAIAGQIITENDLPVEDVHMQASITMPDEMMTDGEGEYMFDNLDLGENYTLTPARNDDFGNGISTLDVILIAKHILGTSALDSPYKIIAADINHSNTVTTADMIQLRKLILGVIEEFSSNTSWRFIKAAHVFPNPDNPWETLFPEALTINQLGGTEVGMNFIGVKIGDMNGSANVGSFNSVAERSVNGTFYVEVNDEDFIAGEEYEVSFKAGDYEGVKGMQFTLNFDREALELLYVENGIVEDNNFGFQQSERGLISFSWENPGSGEIEAGTNLFSFVFYAKKSAKTSDLFSIDSKITKAEAYDGNYELLDVDLLFKDGEAEEAGFEVFQNIPNPFRNTTTIPFVLPEASMTTLTIYDVSGRTWKRVEAYYEAGYNQIHVDLSTLQINGVLYYKVETSKYTATRKMVIME